jgi:hypothetical protein
MNWCSTTTTRTTTTTMTVRLQALANGDDTNNSDMIRWEDDDADDEDGSEARLLLQQAGFPWNEASLRFAYDEWRIIMGKEREPIEKGRFRNFQYHYRQLVILNLLAQDEARRLGQPLPTWKSLNEEGDSTPKTKTKKKSSRGGGGGGAVSSSSSSSRSTSTSRTTLTSNTGPVAVVLSDGIPILTFWSQNTTTGQVSGMVWNKRDLPDGTIICTSPVPLGVQSGMVVTTSSGSLYRLQ